MLSTFSLIHSLWLWAGVVGLFLIPAMLPMFRQTPVLRQSDSFTSPASSASLPVTDLPRSLLPAQVGLTLIRRNALAILWLLVVAATIVLCGLIWQSGMLLRQLSDDPNRYQMLAGSSKTKRPGHHLKAQAMRDDASRLDRYYSEGVRLSLGMGLCSDERMHPAVLAVLAGNQPPPLVETTVPAPVRLNSLPLFDVGSAMLKPESSKVLTDVLGGIKGQPSWLIVISGHTDATGNAEHNLLLSRARAEAVRHWMQQKGDMPDSCFVVQGFGAQYPIDSNETPEGRGANRRVDIRLVPEAGACSHPLQVLGGQPLSPPKSAATFSL